MEEETIEQILGGDANMKQMTPAKGVDDEGGKKEGSGNQDRDGDGLRQKHKPAADDISPHMSDDMAVGDPSPSKDNKNKMDEYDINDNDSWILELESALLADCDLGTIQKITSGKAVPDLIRADFWTACLTRCPPPTSDDSGATNGKNTDHSSQTKAVKRPGRIIFSEFFDLPEQSQIRKDCQSLVEKLGNQPSDYISVLSDLESIITTFCKNHSIRYESRNCMIEVLEPLLGLELPKLDLYRCFEAIQTHYIPKMFHPSAESSAPSSHKIPIKEDGSSGPHSDDSNKTSTSNHSRAAPFNMLRLLLQYHDPELCSFLDTLKITPDMYAWSWFASLFSANCSLKVILPFWDVYFQLADPNLIFYIALVMLVNAKEQIMEMKDIPDNRQAIIDTLKAVPSALSVDDISDLFYIAEQHYISRTPKVVKKFHSLIFGTQSHDAHLEAVENNDKYNDSSLALPPLMPPDEDSLAASLCLPIPVSDLISQQPQPGKKSLKKGSKGHKTGEADPQGSNASPNCVRYFLVDCRPAEQYNCGHLSTAFHLDCNLMLQAPTAFQTAVQALLASQKVAIEAKSAAGGHHLCFIGSGREEEDHLMNMVIASFLKKQHLYVSQAYGGYEALHRLLTASYSPELVDKYLVDHQRKSCLVCRSTTMTASSSSSSLSSAARNSSPSKFIAFNNGTASSSSSSLAEVEHFATSLFDKMASAVKSRVPEVKEKLAEYIKNPHQPVERHVSAGDKLGKRYMGPASNFSIDDDDGWSSFVDSDSDHPRGQEIDIEEYCSRDDVIKYFPCQEIKHDDLLYPSFLVLTKTHLLILRETQRKQEKPQGKLIAKRPLQMVVQITSKRRCPELITFKYGQLVFNGGSENGGSPSVNSSRIVAADHLLIPKPYEVTRLVKQQIVAVLDGSDEQASGSSSQANPKKVPNK